MKKILALLIALAMILALAACGGGTKAPASTTPAETTSEGANLDDPWFTAPKGTVARRVIAHHESSSEFLGEKIEDVYDEVVAYDADDNQLYTRWIETDGQKSENTFEYDSDGNRTLWIGRSEEQGEYYRCVY
ncbi:MAG: hypothetical protein IKZ78_00755, partial [Firmicutes bacterium]|nr:hypothetical protein [Bacillota bacterium]